MQIKGAHAAKGVEALALLVVIALALLMLGASTACSTSSSSGSKGAEQTINGYSVSEYNADVDNLERILNEAKSLDHRIEAMGDPNSFTSQDQVDEYNSLVDSYNSVSSRYNNAAKSFSSKYGNTIDGAGTRPTDPDNIDLPSKR